MGFTNKVFNEVVLTYSEQSTTSYEYCTLFPSLGFIPLGFTIKVLIRHILDGDHSRGSVVNEGFLHLVNDHIHIMWVH